MAHIRNLFLLILLLVAVAIAGCAENTTVTAPKAPGTTDSSGVTEKTPGTPATTQEAMRLTIYYATQDASYLVAERHTVAKNSHPAKTAIELLLAEPTDKQLVSVLPASTKLRNLIVKDHIAYVDFDEKLIKGNIGGSATERLTVGAIVNTLTEFTDIHKVQILVEGKVVQTLTGHMDVSKPLSRSEGIIKK